MKFVEAPSRSHAVTVPARPSLVAAAVDVENVIVPSSSTACWLNPVFFPFDGSLSATNDIDAVYLSSGVNPAAFRLTVAASVVVIFPCPFVTRS